ncbi:hypothetical protein V8E53_005634 [Lactarius tabidus]
MSATASTVTIDVQNSEDCWNKLVVVMVPLYMKVGKGNISPFKMTKVGGAINGLEDDKLAPQEATCTAQMPYIPWKIFTRIFGAKGQKVPQTWGIIQETYAALSGGLYSQGPWPHGCLI